MDSKINILINTSLNNSKLKNILSGQRYISGFKL